MAERFLKECVHVPQEIALQQFPFYHLTQGDKQLANLNMDASCSARIILLTKKDTQSQPKDDSCKNNESLQQSLLPVLKRPVIPENYVNRSEGEQKHFTREG